MKILNSFYLKILAIIFMTIDHIGVIFNLGDIYRIIGRLSFPLFAFLIYQGFTHTRNRLKYFLRLFGFGIIIEVGLYLISYFMYIPQTSRNIFLTLSFGLLALMVIKSNFNLLLKFSTIAYLLFVAYELQFDYSWYGVLFILSFIFYPKYYYLSFIAQLFMTAFDIHVVPNGWVIQYYALFSWVFILLYNHKKGISAKYLFYVYYPLHLGVLYLIAYFYF